MKRIYLFQGCAHKHTKILLDVYTEVDDEDYEYLQQWEWWIVVPPTAKGRIRYAKRRQNNKTIYMHRVILDLIDPKDKADHKDKDGLNNQRHNLRKSTHGQNMSNRKSWDNSSSKYLGVFWNSHAKKWAVSCRYNGELRTKTTFSTEEDAALYYNKIALEMKGEFAGLNVVELQE